MSQNFNQKVYEYVKTVPPGKVVTYGQVACAIGCPHSARQVGWALHKNPEFGVIPCHRVVFADGSVCAGFAFGGKDVQKAMLESEGVEVADYKIDLKKFRWNG
ncbi:MAG: MGMT family protein [Clostridia bacterium]|nr:MGMT family protein [Clostridia bacterium]